jgi:hypothetical protein
MGYTITKTNRAGLTRKLKNLGFQPYDIETSIGFSIIPMQDEDFHVIHHTYQEGTAAETLMANGYGVDSVSKRNNFNGHHVETFYVYGKKHYN